MTLKVAIIGAGRMGSIVGKQLLGSRRRRAGSSRFPVLHRCDADRSLAGNEDGGSCDRRSRHALGAA